MQSDWVCNHTSDCEVGFQFVNHDYDYRPTSDDTKSNYQLIISSAISEENCEFSSNVHLAQPTGRLQVSN